jgi:phenylalanyl-tRNA synthetase alpha chain
MKIEKELAIIEQDLQESLAQCKSLESLEQIRITFLGRQGRIAQITETFKESSPEEKRRLGPLLNTLKTKAHELFETKKEHLNTQLSKAAQSKAHYFDVTAYRYSPLQGSLHIYTHLTHHITSIFTSMGYAIVDGPEVETEYYNFEALNIPADHPAREMQDTFWLYQPAMLLRTHTSAVQARMMETMSLPLAICAPGRVYRNEQTDASHDFMFTQVEGMFIDKKVSMAHLLATAQVFLQALFEKPELNIRVRPGYFPFVEPGVEIDASCPFCTSGCSICKKTRWIELLGAGLVHPNVLQAGGIDPNKYSGFAFGMGIERVAMIKYGITDIRLFHSTKIAFLDQF